MSKEPEMVYCIVITLTLKSAVEEPLLLHTFNALQQQCQQYEPGTITHELLRDDENPLRFSVVGRYASRESMEEIYEKNPLLHVFLQTTTSIASDRSYTKMSSVSVNEDLKSLQPGSISMEFVESVREAVSAAATAGNQEIKEPHSLRQQKGVLVFCGSRNGSRSSYVKEAELLGEYLALTLRRPLVYGGGTVGIMGTVALSTQQHGGRVIAVLPHSLAPREVSGAKIGDILYMTETMSERKSIMFAHADTVVALPGGAGTFDELLEVLTLLQLNAYRPKVGLVNVDGFFDPFIALMKHMVTEGFMEELVLQAFVVRPTAVELMQALESFTPPTITTLKWNARP
ncbi:lysine decarboxylase-like protein [Trypanosoma theileri]|uniref:Lysine decarboxylase-like protein n=1 Tax=Trypanosoma theileri TaxID=67003 RepID=A0A1X0NSV2_9TRYP|nr:lysine decarboxylase-like protein [Trypanosoma theileri]ORC87772.1 lysine decarboxylase-like protein [Trypanosoma theileri]